MAAAVPCASCHGTDGRGRPEGGVTPPDITAPSLAAARAAAPGRRARPAYDAVGLIRAVTLGIDPAGNRLDPVMPRFALSRADADALVAFLQCLGTTPDPGVEPDAIVIGTVQRAGRAPLAQLLDAYAQRINRDGAVFGRKIRVVSAEIGVDEAPSAAIARLASTTALFCLVAPDIAGDESASVSTATALGLPLIGPLTLRPRIAPRSRYVFYLDGGAAALGRALATYTVRSGAGSPVQIVDDGSPLWHDAAEAAATVLDRAGSPAVRCGLDDACAEGDRDARVLWFADGAGRRAELERALSSASSVLLPAAAAPDLLNRPTSAKIVIAYPEIAADIAPYAAAELRQLAAATSDPGRAAQRAVLAAAKLLVDGLEHAGRTLTREGLVSAIENTEPLRTGLMPQLSFSAVRHIGSSGAWIVSPGGGPPEWVDAP